MNINFGLEPTLDPAVECNGSRYISRVLHLYGVSFEGQFFMKMKERLESLWMHDELDHRESWQPISFLMTIAAAYLVPKDLLIAYDLD